MPSNTVAIKKDVDSKPIAQYYNPNKDSYEALEGANGASNIIIVDSLPVGTNTIGSIKIAGNDILLQGNITLTGEAQQVNPNLASRVVTIQAEPTNTGYVYVGKSNVSSTIHMFTLSPGNSITIGCSNLNLLYVIGTSGDKICYGGEA